MISSRDGCQRFRCSITILTLVLISSRTPSCVECLQVTTARVSGGGGGRERYLLCISSDDGVLVVVDVDEEMDENPMAYKLRWETGYLNGAPFKVRVMGSGA